MQLYVNQEIEIWVCTSNGTDQLSLVRPEYSGPALKVVHIDKSGHFSRLDHLTKLLSPVSLFCILLTRTITKCTMAWVRSVQPECTVLLGMQNVQDFQTGIFVEWKAPLVFS